MSKITLTDLANLQNENTAVNAINTNNQVIELAFDNTLSRDGTAPNQMQASLDMNDHRIINLPNPATPLEPLRLQDLMDFLGTGTISTIPSGGTAGQVLTKDTAVDYDVSWVTPKPSKNFFLSNYASLQAACDAAVAANGGTVIIDTSTTLSSSLNLDGVSKPLRITGFGVPNGSGAWPPYINYTGTGTAISMIGAVNVELDHLFLYCTNASGASKVINAQNASYIHIHDNVFLTTNSNATNLGIDLDTTVAPRIIGNAFHIAGGTGIRGVAPAGSFSVRAEIAENYFGNSTNICISSPGQAWRIVGNTAQNPPTCFLEAGPATTCDVVYLNGNDVDDLTGTKTVVSSNAGALISVNNRYTDSGGGAKTCISQTNSTGAVTSIGDRLEGSVGIAIGTGNYLTIINPDQYHLPTSLYTGTPANTNVTNLVGGRLTVTGRVETGTNGSAAGAVRIYNATAGTNYVDLTPPAGATGSLTFSFPTGGAGTILVDSNIQAITGAKTFGAAGNVGKLRIAGNTSGTITLDAAAVAGTNTLTLPAATDTLVGLSTTDTLSNKTLSSAAYTGTFIGTTTSANALAVGRQGSTNPVLQIDASTASQVTGVKITGAAAAGGAFIAAISSGANETLLIDAKGTGGITMGATSTGSIVMSRRTVVNTSGADIFKVGTTTPVFGGAGVTIANGANTYMEFTDGTRSMLFGADVGGTFFGSYSNNPLVMRANNTPLAALFTSGGFSINSALSDPGAGNLSVQNAISAGNSIKSSHATAGIGYATGAGGTVTQITSRTTGVTINKACGQITLFNAAGSTSYTTFTVTNSAVAATDNVVVNCSSGTNVYLCHVTAIAAGSFAITFNTTGGTAADSPVFNFSVIKGVSA